MQIFGDNFVRFGGLWKGIRIKLRKKDEETGIQCRDNGQRMPDDIQVNR